MHARAHALLVLALVLGALAVIPPTGEAATFPSVTLEVVRIQEIDAIDLFGGDWDWYYWVGRLNGSVWEWKDYQAPDGQDVPVNQVITFIASSPSLTFAITACEGDTFSNDDVADLSEGPAGGLDDEPSNCDQSGKAPFGGAYVGTWNLTTDTLSGHLVSSDPQGWRTSGDFDGNGGDENDANLWFTIADDYDPPVADAGPDRSGTVLATVTLNGTGSTGFGASLESFAWDLDGDGDADASGPEIAHLFATNGTHEVTLRVTDSIGGTASDTVNVTIGNVAPVADFGFGPPEPTTEDTVRFFDGSFDADGTVVAWTWDFGDGGTATTADANHTFADDGAYEVRLTVMDDSGAAGTTSRTVNVSNSPPIALFHTPDTSPVSGEDIRFLPDALDLDGSIVAWSWSFGDGNVSDERNATHAYAAAGTYVVSLTVTDDDGDTDMATLQIDVGSPPVSPDGDAAYWLLALLLVFAVPFLVFAFLRRRKRDDEEGDEGTPAEPPPDSEDSAK